MLFELSVAKNYLLPKKGRLSSSLIALMSIGVVSLIVWLILVFLSVTDGIEKSWVDKLTTFNAPIRITPTDAYYNSYYYQVDSISSESNFSYKSIQEKAISPFTDPYNPNEDIAIPNYWPPNELDANGLTKDLVKSALTLIQNQTLPLIAQPYEVGGALLKIYTNQPKNSLFDLEEECKQSCITQTLYITSFSDKNPHLQDLIEPPRTQDLNHLFEQMRSFSASEFFAQQLRQLLENITIKKIRNVGKKMTHLVPLLPLGKPFEALCHRKNGQIVALTVGQKKKGEMGSVRRERTQLIFTCAKGEETKLSLLTPLFSEDFLCMESHIKPYDITKVKKLSDLQFDVSFFLQNAKITGTIAWEGVEIAEAKRAIFFTDPPFTAPPWVYFVQGRAHLPKSPDRSVPVLLPKKFQAKQIKMGDRGGLSYYGSATRVAQEHQLPIRVVGFYDPGVIPIGDLMVLTKGEIVRTINASSPSALLDQNLTNGIQVWCPMNKTKKVHAELRQVFDQAGLLPYWDITPYYEYDFARDLFQQFQSDKYLLTFIGIIILAVACTNIISLLMILVNDKKKEIAILSAMGASRKSIAWIFTLCGGMVGCVSTCIGIFSALITMHNIEHLVHFLSFLQGQEAFNTLIYGTSLPSQLSDRALIFTLITTPVISLFAGLIPAIKACKVHPSKMLRSS